MFRRAFNPERFKSSLTAVQRRVFDPARPPKSDTSATFQAPANIEKRPDSTQLSHFVPVSRQPFFHTRSIKEYSSFGQSDAPSEQSLEHKNDIKGEHSVLKLDYTELKRSYDVLSRLLTCKPDPNKVYDALGRDSLLEIMEKCSPDTFHQLVETKKEVEDLHEGQGYVVIGNTGIESASPKLAELITITLASVYGFPDRTPGGGFALPIKDNPNAKVRLIFGDTTAEAPFHTDSTFLSEPVDSFVLTCVKPAKHGGTSQLVDGWKLAKQMKEECPEVYSTLTETQFPFVVPKGYILAAKLKGHDIKDIACAPMISPECIRYRRDNLKLDKLSPEQLKALEIFEKYLSNAPVYEHDLKAGEGLIINNRRFLHARTSFHGDKDRHLFRVWMNKEQRS